MTKRRMSHRDAVQLLPAFVSGELENGSAAALQVHLSQCSECREWVDAYATFERLLGNDASPNREHPESELLALCVVRPEEEFEPGRERLREHLKCCPFCRRQVRALRDAVQQARPVHSEGGGHRRQREARKVRRRVLAAAALCILAVGLAVVYASLDVQSKVSESTRINADPGVHRPKTEAAEQLSGLEIGDLRLIETDHRLVVSNVKVRPGGRVTFRAGEAIAFGDGFQIAEGGAVVVEAGRPGRRR